MQGTIEDSGAGVQQGTNRKELPCILNSSCSMMREYTKRTLYAHIIAHACVCAHTHTQIHTINHAHKSIHVLIRAPAYTNTHTHARILAGVSGESNTPWKELGWHSSPFTGPRNTTKSEALGSAAADLKFIGGHPVGIELVKEREMGLAAGPDGGIFPTP
jgi:hypothetical protein